MRAAIAILILWLCGTAFAQEHKVGVLYYTEPVFPPIALQAGVHGDVVVQLDLNESGFVQRMTILSGHPMLNQAALASLQKWHFICLDCKDPVALTHRFTMTYTLPKERYSCAPSPARKAIPDFPHNRMTVEAPTECIESDPDGLPAHEHKVGVTKYVVPVYPPIARQARVQGDVVIDLQLDANGNVTGAAARSGHRMLQEAAIKAAKEWRFTCGSCPVSQPLADRQVTFRFALDGQQSDLGSQWYTFGFPETLTIHANPPQCWAYVTQIKVTPRPWYLRWMGRKKVESISGDVPC